MTRSRHELALRATVVEAARTAVGEQLRRDLVPEPSPEMRELIARLVALDSEKRRAAERGGVASSPLQLPQLPER